MFGKFKVSVDLQAHTEYSNFFSDANVILA